jgi:hypothetical protein
MTCRPFTARRIHESSTMRKVGALLQRITQNNQLKMFKIISKPAADLVNTGNLVGLLDRASQRFFAKAWPSYAIILLLQLKILWKIWVFRDLTTGDTSSYFVKAYEWYENFAVNIVWSPLYTAFYGSVFMLTHDVYDATTLHRVIIVIVATTGILLLMRTLLPPAVAILIATWWAVMPINFNTFYEVHLFALLPILAAWCVAAWKDAPWNRGTALAILVAATILVRNEFVVAVILFAVFCLIRHINESRRSERQMTKQVWLAYALPLLVAVTACAFFYWRSKYKFPEIADVSKPKHTVNMCQVYAVGYQQRYSDWTLNPWLYCSQLMEKVFGQPLPTLYEMIKANSAAVWEHFLWNLSLLPNGLQVLLFNVMSGTVNPDYPPVTRHAAAVVLSIAVISLIILAVLRVVRDRTSTWRDWFKKSAGTWLGMIAVVCVAAPVILTQRPRPSYLFPVGVFSMAIVGSAIYILSFGRMAILERVAICLVFVVLVVVPPYFVTHPSDRPLYSAYQRLQPFRGLILNRKDKVLLGDYNGELRGYLVLTRAYPNSLDYSVLLSWTRESNLADFLGEKNIGFVFLQPRIVSELRNVPQAGLLFNAPETFGWRRLVLDNSDNPSWFILYRD